MVQLNVKYNDNHVNFATCVLVCVHRMHISAGQCHCVRVPSLNNKLSEYFNDDVPVVN